VAKLDTQRGGVPIEGLVPLRVATLLSFPLAGGSGLGTFVLGMTEALDRSPRLELVLIAPDRIRAGAGRRFAQALFSLQQLVQLCRARPDVVHTHDHPALLAAAVGYRLLFGSEKRVVYTLHFDPVEKRSLWKRAVLGSLLSRCSAITVVAQDSLTKLPFLATPVPNRSSIHIVPGAAAVRIRTKTDPEVVAFRRALGVEEGPVLLQVSNFTFPAKVEGTVRLLQALADVRRSFPNVQLLLLGTGPLVGVAREARDRLGLETCVKIPGVFIDDLSLPVGLSDIHCHITLQDACPISILEAMHAAKPVIASRTGGIPELIEQGISGLLVGNDPQEIARAIIDLLQHPERAMAIGWRAQQVAQSRFTWERVAADFEVVYGVAQKQVREVTGTLGAAAH
jgi:glycosyltransferase involved in cell wall biosynthesis